jgi:hypothetical protein
MVPACQKCNSLKNNYLPEEFIIFLTNEIERGCRNKERYKLIIKNTKSLIEKIASYRGELFSFVPTSKGIANSKLLSEEEAKKKKRELLEVFASFPPARVSVNVKPKKEVKPVVKTEAKLTTEQQIKKLASKFPHIYQVIVDANPDLPRWIFDNVVNNKYFYL